MKTDTTYRSNSGNTKGKHWPKNWIGQKWGNTIYWGRLKIQVYLNTFIPVACMQCISQYIDNIEYFRYWQDICNQKGFHYQRYTEILLDWSIWQVLLNRRVLPNIRESWLSSMIFQGQDCHTEQGFRAGLIPQWPIFVLLQPRLAKGFNIAL